MGSLAGNIPTGWCEQVTFAYLHLGTGDPLNNRCTDKSWCLIFTDRILFEMPERIVCEA